MNGVLAYPAVRRRSGLILGLTLLVAAGVACSTTLTLPTPTASDPSPVAAPAKETPAPSEPVNDDDPISPALRRLNPDGPNPIDAIRPIYHPTGTALTLMPSSIVPWKTWLADHPDATVLSNDDTGLFYRAKLPTDGFVIGVAFEHWASAYPYGTASVLRIINDRIGDHPMVVFVDPDTRDISDFLRVPFAPPPGQAVPDELVL